MTPLSTPTDDAAIRDLMSSSGSSSGEDDIVAETVGGGDFADSNKSPLCLVKGRLPTKPAQGCPRSAGKIARRKGTMRWLDQNNDVKWDNDETTGVELNRFQVNKLRSCACEIVWVAFSQSSATPSTYTGQGGLVRGPGESIKFLTANHNICSELNSEGEWEAVANGFKCLTFNGASKQLLQIPRAGWERTEGWTKKNVYPLGRTDEHGVELSWKYGVDISLGPEVSGDDPSGEELLDIVGVNEVVPDDFVYEEGLKLGMVIYTAVGPDYGNEKIVNKGMSEKDLRDCLGGPNEVVIFTGKITRADIDKEHVEHDVNAFGGCSGGHLIVLEKDHEHFGKVAAVHVGSKVETENNIGFKVAGIFSKY